MKIRWGFVTNSSSTSFLIISKGMPSRHDFFAAVGIGKGSPLASLFDQLYAVISNYLEPVEKLKHQEDSMSVHEAVRKVFSERTACEVDGALENDMSVWVGRLHTDGEFAESFFSLESFEVRHKTFYLNALPCIF